jgi:hypothetical protein
MWVEACVAIALQADLGDRQGCRHRPPPCYPAIHALSSYSLLLLNICLQQTHQVARTPCVSQSNTPHALLPVQVAPDGPVSSSRRLVSHWLSETPGDSQGSASKWEPSHALALARLVQELSSDLDQLVPELRRGNKNKYARNLRINKVRKGCYLGA